MCTSLLSLSFHRFAGWQLTSTRAKFRQSIHTSYQFLVHIKNYWSTDNAKICTYFDIFEVMVPLSRPYSFGALCWSLQPPDMANMVFMIIFRTSSGDWILFQVSLWNSVPLWTIVAYLKWSGMYAWENKAMWKLGDCYVHCHIVRCVFLFLQHLQLIEAQILEHIAWQNVITLFSPFMSLLITLTSITSDPRRHYLVLVVVVKGSGEMVRHLTFYLGTCFHIF